MGQIPCGPVLASKEEGELIHVHESEHCDTQYLKNWHNGSNCIIFANIVTMNAFLSLPYGRGLQSYFRYFFN